MSRADKTKFETPSTVEAIKMASASILGTTTNLGYPLGSAVGSGSMMEENSDTVSMNIAPLVFSIRDALMGAEGLEILALEWDLERTPGPGVLPEQLVVAGGTSEGIGSHVCVLGWEKGVVDPFKIDLHMRRLSKKLADIESAVMNNGLSYESEGLPVLRKFNDRFNRVLFVEMLDRRFQGSWDSFQLKQEQVDIEAEASVNFHDDFTLLPPGPKITERTMLDFMLPATRPEKMFEHFKHRVLTPTGIEALTVKVPEAGRAILSELNTFAYSMEEVNLARSALSLLTEFLGFKDATLDQLVTLRQKSKEFMGLLTKTISSFEEIVSQHVGSGKTLSIEGHKEALLAEINLHGEWFAGFGQKIGLYLVEELIKSIRRTFPVVSEIRAWQLRSTVSYYIIYAKQVPHYFATELSQYLIVTSARKAFISALQAFRTEMTSQEMDAISMKLFEKFYSEIYGRLNAILDRVAYTGSKQQTFSELMDIIAREMMEFFEDLDVWDLIGFADVADIARAEIEKRYMIEDTIDPIGAAIQEILDTFETLVTSIIPDVADTLLSKAQIRRVVDRSPEDTTPLLDSFIEFVETGMQKPDEWKAEAKNWIESCKASIPENQPLAEQLLTLVRFIHNKVGLGATAQAIVDKVTDEADRRELAYEEVLEAWRTECKRIDSENEPIRINNRNRADALARAQNQYAQEMTRYEAEMIKYRQELEASKTLPEDTPAPIITEPSRPKSLDSRIVEINNQYPEMEEKPMPLEPEPPDDLAYYVGLRDLLNERLRLMDVSKEQMEEIFTERLQRMKAEGTSASEGISVSLEDEFLEYLKNSTIRSLGKLLPRATRAYLRNPQIPDLLYLVTYEHKGSELVIRISDNHLRIGGGA